MTPDRDEARDAELSEPDTLVVGEDVVGAGSVVMTVVSSVDWGIMAGPSNCEAGVLLEDGDMDSVHEVILEKVDISDVQDMELELEGGGLGVGVGARDALVEDDTLDDVLELCAELANENVIAVLSCWPEPTSTGCTLPCSMQPAPAPGWMGNGPAMAAAPVLSASPKPTLAPTVAFAAQRSCVSAMSSHTTSMCSPSLSLTDIVSVKGGTPLCQRTASGVHCCTGSPSRGVSKVMGARHAVVVPSQPLITGY